ncbi:MAG: DUF2095 domain-containing protein [Candidatus Bathyarchaeota archaeon]|nr:DUF2095 domain-containing protein [Candidatus Bathyarchaeota archaeon]
MIDKKSIRKMFPNLIKELEDGENKVSIDGVRADADQAEEEIVDAEDTTIAEAENAMPDKFRHYSPTVVDFIRRCDTCDQAEEIISYLQKRGELSEERACEVREQLKKEGLRSFGPKKEDDYYFKQSGLC